MRIVGIDLAITSAHKAVVMEGNGRFVSPVFSVHTWPESLTTMIERARAGAAEDEPLVAVMEPTGAMWLPVAIYLFLRGVTVYLVNSQQVADLRRFYKKHAKSDRIDARVLAKLYLVSQEKLHPLQLPSAEIDRLRRLCKQLDWVTDQSTKLTNKLIALDRLVWLNGWADLGFSDPFGPVACWCRQHYYNPYTVLQAGAEQIRRDWQASEVFALDDRDHWIEALVCLAEKVTQVYGTPSQFVDFDALQDEACLNQKWLLELKADRKRLWQEQVRPLYQRVHPSGNLETIYGIAEQSAAVFVSFLGDPQRFENAAKLRSWSGMVPRSSQSSDSQSKGLKISQAGPAPIKKYSFLCADVGRRFDPQLAAIYHDQMVNKGQHHKQAVCAVATHLLDRIRVIATQDRPYVLRDVDGTPVTPEQARQIIAERYHVPDEVRQRNNRKNRRKRVDRQAERQFERKKRKRESSPELVRG